MNDKTLGQPRLVLHPAGAGVRAVLVAGADDDGGELRLPGHDGAEQLLLERHRLVRASARPEHRYWRPVRARARAEPVVLRGGAPARGPARHHRGAEPAAPGLGGGGGAGGDRAADANPVQRRRHHLADLRAGRYRAAGGRAERHRHPVQRHAGPAFGLVHDRADRCLALDADGRVAVLRRVEGHSGRVIIKRHGSTAPGAGRCSSISSCRSCGGC